MLSKLTSISIITLGLTAPAMFGQSAQSKNLRQGTAAIKSLTGVVSDSMWGQAYGEEQNTRRVYARVRKGRFRLRSGCG